MSKAPPLTVVVWKWGKARNNSPQYRHSFTAEHVNVVHDMVRRNYKLPLRFVCITDDPTGVDCETFPLWSDCDMMTNGSGMNLPSCYRRLKIFSDEISHQLGPRIVSLDLDVVICGDMTPIWEQDYDFVGWKKQGCVHQIVYNGSMFMFRAGRFNHLWATFDPDRSPYKANQAGYFGSDQAWISYNFKGTMPGWTIKNGVYSYPQNVRRQVLPADAAIVIFHGKRKPWEENTQMEAPWIKKHWRIIDATVPA